MRQTRTMKNFRPSLNHLWPWLATILAGIALFLVFPGDFTHKANWVLHGLCAQNPNHTHRLGDELLPLDARCVGIYTGTILTLVILAARGRLLAMELPQKKFLAVLGVFFATLALDGGNSLLGDLGWWHPWESSNLTRVVSGYLMGIAMAVALVWLVAGTVFRIGDNEPAIQQWGDFGWFLMPIPVVFVILETGISWLHGPISIFLMVSAWIVIGTLAFVTFLLATRIDDRITHRRQLRNPGMVGLIAGAVIMILLAFGRAWMERALGIPTSL